MTNRESVKHYLKSWPRLFDAILSGNKNFDLRRADRDFQVGDTVILCEFDPYTETYSGQQCEVEITYITSTSTPCALSEQGLHEGFCILSYM